ncbi:MAG: ribosome-associated translation inhibitor RaiA [Chloroflexi bacterium]|nr:ribosome-associated translation inhibitor RaiA [Chloroflexota bacterium]
MNIVIKSKNVEVPDRLREYIEKKVARLDRYLSSVDEARIELSTASAKSADDRQIVQLTLRVNGTLLRAEERSSDMQTSIDYVLDKMERQISRFKGKHWHTRSRAAAAQAAPVAEPVEPEAEGEIVRVKKFQTRPMDVDEAIEQMELLGHDFFAFYDTGSNAFCVVYKRRDGGYGLLQPELA